MPRRTDTPAERADQNLVGRIRGLIEGMNGDPRFLRHVAEFDRTALVLSATDTGRTLRIVFDSGGVRLDGDAGAPFDVMIRATEKVHWAVFSGRMDADAAFFAGKVRLRGSVATAFRVKNRFLSLLQWHVGQAEQAMDQSTAS